MIHLPHLVIDLGLILGAAAITTLIFKKLKQPLVLGYLIAGFLVGPHIHFIPTVTDEANIKVWAEIGVIFLLFSLGLEFSFKKLMKVGGSASITALVEVIGMLAIGYGIGQVLGWSVMDSIFLGGVLSISSTTIIIRAFEELGVKGQKFAGLVFGVLVVEDLVAIVLLVLLSTLAVSQQFAGMEMLVSVLKLVFFPVLWFVGGIFFIPTLLKRTKKLMSEETLLVTSLGLCFLMVILATKVGFSPALGAFIMGSILAETTQAEKIEHLVKSVKDLFGAIFFVSVGMLIDPKMLVEYIGPVLLISAVTIVGKMVFSAGGALISGQPLKSSVQTGMSLAQIGEFSFIIATLGLDLKVTSGFLYPIAVAVSALTTFTTPYFIKYAEPFYYWIERHLPEKWKDALTRYSSGAQSISVVSDWQRVLRGYFSNVLIYSVILLALTLVSSFYVRPWTERALDGNGWVNIATLVITLLIMSPFLWALAVRQVHSEITARLWQESKYRGPIAILRTSRLLLAVFFVGFLLDQFFSFYVAVLTTLGILGALLIFQRKIQAFYDKLESRFISNYNEREAKAIEAQARRDALAPWDAHLASFEVRSESPVVGKTLLELGLREQYGVNVAMIERGTRLLTLPAKDERLYPGDKLDVIGTDEQVKKFSAFLEPIQSRDEEERRLEVVLRSYEVHSGSSVMGKTIRSSGIREQGHGLVVGIERNGNRILNPDSTIILQDGDIVWIVGNPKRLPALFRVKTSKK
ncbi:cation:proton antiporter [Chitinophaga sedimenti]|uniref:cation:proton antiporter domain-containing protein n=1 Tax=Chitinophaga sedimenti TaxID=2033606 RepID=UPI0020030F40|nr:cation:proton antiporter [Chitinophaga sedimenti]MCK7557307.1 cation:proton antiporter [Chitinophaga sedimenti]